MAKSPLSSLSDGNELTIEGELRLAHELAFAIGEAENEHEALGTVLARVCRATGWQLGQAWTWRGDGLRCCPAWYCDSDVVQASSDFRALSEATTLPPGIGLPGTVWQTRRGLWILPQKDSGTPKFLRADAARKAGLKVALAVPVAAGDEIVAVLEFFSFHERDEDQSLLYLVSSVAIQLGSLLLRKRAEVALRESEATLRESEAELRALLRAINDLVIVLDGEGRYLKIAPTHNELLFQPAAAMLGKTLHEVLPPGQAAKFMEAIECALRTQRTVEIEYSMPIGGATTWFMAHISPMSEDRVVWVARDISARKRSEVALAQAEERYRGIFENAVEGIFQTDATGRYLSANPALAQIYGYDSPRALMLELTDISHQLYLESGRREEFTRLLASHDRVSRFESRVRRKDETVIWISENARAVRDENGDLLYYEGTVEDITERKWQQREVEDQQTRLQEINLQLQVLATIDSLTGLKNHRSMQDTLRHESERAAHEGTPLSVVLLDVDRFKSYNDTFGHPAGDDVLRHLARILKKNARETDDVARYGGEEFVAILPGADHAVACECAERFRKAIQNAPWISRPVTASFGIATFQGRAANDENAREETARDETARDETARDETARDDAPQSAQTRDTQDTGGETTHTTLLASADKALYWSKTNGRNRITHIDDIR